MSEQARRYIRPKRVRFTTDRSFVSSYSPPHLSVTQFLSITELWPTLTRTFTVLSTYPRGRTHSREGGNLGVHTSAWFWIPASAGMTRLFR
jgi:hypothetical protein